MGDCLAPGDWPVVRGLAVGLTRRQGIRRAVLGHVYDGAAVPVSCEGGVVRLRAAHMGFKPGHRFRLLFGGGAGHVTRSYDRCTAKSVRITSTNVRNSRMCTLLAGHLAAASDPPAK